METGETSASATPPPPEDPAEDKRPITLRCLLFFDGTLNNKGNIDERKKHESGQSSDIYLKNRKNQDKEQRLKKGDVGIDLEDDSYENDYTNIVSLETNVALQQAGHDETLIVYIEGSGTLEYIAPKDGSIADNKDQMSGYAFSAWESGIKAKVEKALVKAVEKIKHGPNDRPRKNDNLYIKKLTLDIFGFSRGAASARYGVHRLLQDMTSAVGVDAEDESPVYRTETYIQKRLRTLHHLDVTEVEIRFVGLFDTVTSYYGLQIVPRLPLERWLVKLDAIQHEKVKKVVHLASAEEHRGMFCLHNIKSAGSKGEEYFLPGVHSDVGGGYLDEGSDANLIVFQGTPQEAARDRHQYLIAQGWFKPEQLTEEVTRYREDEYGNELEAAAVRLRVKKQNEMKPNETPRIVRNAYRQIPLKLMAEFAGKNEITFESDLSRDATKTINTFPELTRLESRIRAHMQQAGPRGSRPEAWQKIEPEFNAIRHKHLHFSARYNGTLNGLGHNPRYEKGQRKRYTFKG